MARAHRPESARGCAAAQPDLEVTLSWFWFVSREIHDRHSAARNLTLEPGTHRFRFVTVAIEEVPDAGPGNRKLDRSPLDRETRRPELTDDVQGRGGAAWGAFGIMDENPRFRD